MIPSTSVRKLIERALLTALSTSGLLTACGPAPIDANVFKQPACNSNGALALDDVTPARPVDFMQMSRLTSDRGGNMYNTATVISTAGTQCLTATDKPACIDKLGMVKLTAGFAETCVQICNASAVVTTSGDDISEITTQDAWRAFLGTIDSMQEATLLAYSKGYEISCTDLQEGAVRKTTTGFEVIGMKGFACGANTARRRFTLAIDTDGTLKEAKNEIVKVGDPNCAVGRRPAGLLDASMTKPQSALGHFFSEIAFLEAASVTAFSRMEAELTALGAPKELAARARLAQRDEVRHAQVTAALASRFGGEAPHPQITDVLERSLEAIALENAVEGCVRETFGALVAHHQAHTASDAEIALAMKTIAEDETNHAELSWDVHSFLSAKLSHEERSRIRAAQQLAIESLRTELSKPIAPDVMHFAGMPSPDVSISLLNELKQTLWS